MAIAFTCVCGKRRQVKGELAGKRVKCPECGEVQVVPGGSEGITTAAPRPRPAAAPPEEAPDSWQKPKARASRFQDEENEAPARRTRAAVDEEDEEDRPAPRRRKRRPRYDDDEAPRVRRPFFSVNGGMVAGLAMMAIAVVWFFGGLMGGIIFFYPPVLFVIGLVAFVKGMSGRA